MLAAHLLDAREPVAGGAVEGVGLVLTAPQERVVDLGVELFDPAAQRSLDFAGCSARSSATCSTAVRAVAIIS
jgi:hypothetical protein